MQRQKESEENQPELDRTSKRPNLEHERLKDAEKQHLPTQNLSR